MPMRSERFIHGNDRAARHGLALLAQQSRVLANALQERPAANMIQPTSRRVASETIYHSVLLQKHGRDRHAQAGKLWRQREPECARARMRLVSRKKCWRDLLGTLRRRMRRRRKHSSSQRDLLTWTSNPRQLTGFFWFLARPREVVFPGSQTGSRRGG